MRIYRKKEKKVRHKKISNTIMQLIPIRKYDHLNECYIYENGSIMDLVRIKCKDFGTQSNSDMEMDMLLLTGFFRLYKEDFKLVSINIPTNCEEQLAFINHKLSKCKNEYCRQQLEIKKSEQEWIEKNRLNKEFYIMYFARDLEEFRKQKGLINDQLGSNNLLVPISKKDKDIVLMKMANKNIKS